MPIPPIAITAFGGEVPAVDERLLGDNNAADSVNAWLLSGRVEPVRSLQPLHVLNNPSARAWFRLPIASADIDHMSDSYWLEFENENVRVIRSPVVGQDDDGRYYWADGVFPKYVTGEMIAQMNATMKGAWDIATNYNVNDGVTFGGATYVSILGGVGHQPDTSPAFWVLMPTPLHLGVPAPTTAPGVVVSGGVSTTNKTVSYVYTWVTEFGEEGPPSPPTTVDGKIDAMYSLTLTAPTGAQTANRKLTNTRIYRTVVSASGVATFFFVAEIPITTLTYDDDAAVATDAVIVDNEQLQTVTWSGPPDDLQGLVTMPNGMIAGWRENEVWFCEPYYPHAWPVQYTIAVDPKIVGLGVYNQSLIILCEGQPYAATGVHPSQMSLAKVQPLEACTSMRSIVNTPNGVLYSSPNGLINITPAGAVNLTLQTILKSQWNDRLHLPSVMASVISQAYYCYSGSAGRVFQEDSYQNDAFQQESAFGSLPGAYISLVDQRLGITVLDPAPVEVVNVITDIFNGETMVLRDGVIYLVDTRQMAPYSKYRWRSKIFTLPYLQNLGAAKVYWTPPDVTTVPSATMFRVFAGESADELDNGLPLRYANSLKKSGEMFRLPSGYKALYYQFEVEGYAVINAIHCAQTPHELRMV